ncbi:MAG: hypothetical protein MHMPM18_000817 [Marteilia pararefringens]
MFNVADDLDFKTAQEIWTDLESKVLLKVSSGSKIKPAEFHNSIEQVQKILAIHDKDIGYIKKSMIDGNIENQHKAIQSDKSNYTSNRNYANLFCPWLSKKITTMYRLICFEYLQLLNETENSRFMEVYFNIWRKYVNITKIYSHIFFHYNESYKFFKNKMTLLDETSIINERIDAKTEEVIAETTRIAYDIWNRSIFIRYFERILCELNTFRSIQNSKADIGSITSKDLIFSVSNFKYIYEHIQKLLDFLSSRNSFDIQIERCLMSIYTSCGSGLILTERNIYFQIQLDFEILMMLKDQLYKKFLICIENYYMVDNLNLISNNCLLMMQQHDFRYINFFSNSAWRNIVFMMLKDNFRHILINIYEIPDENSKYEAFLKFIEKKKKHNCSLILNNCVAASDELYHLTFADKDYVESDRNNPYFIELQSISLKNINQKIVSNLQQLYGNGSLFNICQFLMTIRYYISIFHSDLTMHLKEDIGKMFINEMIGASHRCTVDECIILKFLGQIVTNECKIQIQRLLVETRYTHHKILMKSATFTDTKLSRIPMMNETNYERIFNTFKSIKYTKFMDEIMTAHKYIEESYPQRNYEIIDSPNSVLMRYNYDPERKKFINILISHAESYILMILEEIDHITFGYLSDKMRKMGTEELSCALYRLEGIGLIHLSDKALKTETIINIRVYSEVLNNKANQ